MRDVEMRDVGSGHTLEKVGFLPKFTDFSSSTLLDPAVLPLRPLLVRPSSSGILLLALLERFHGFRAII